MAGLSYSRYRLMQLATTAHALPDVSNSIAGISNDQTEAATITPEAKPSSAFCSFTDISPFIMKTKADPSMVPTRE